MQQPLIIYVHGEFADAIGANGLQKLANDAQALAREKPVEVHTYGVSEFHSRTRFVPKPEET